MKYKKIKDDLIADLKICIDYEPDKENDLLCMMEIYLNSSQKRKELYVEIKNLMNDTPYKNPYTEFYFYNQEDIDALDDVLDYYVYSMLAEDLEDGNILETKSLYDSILINTIFEINDLNDICSNELIDDWRAEKLENFLISVAEYVGFKNAEKIVEREKRW